MKNSKVPTGTLFGLILLLLGVAGLTSAADRDAKTPVDYVNPLIGNISHLLVPTFPTVHLPNSMLRVCPERADFTTDLIKGLPVAITSHRGSSAFNISAEQGDETSLVPVKSYSYDLEKIRPYRYSVYLDEDRIGVDYAPSHHSGLYALTFEEPGKNYIVINVGNGSLCYADGSISGYQIIDGTPTKIYLYLETEQKPLSAGTLVQGKVSYASGSIEGRNCAIVLKYDNAGGRINIRYGISFISAEQAKKNLRAEIGDYSVERLARNGRDIWNSTLGKISVEGNSENDKVVFYTSLYRTYERMINLSEDGRYYSAFDGKIHDDGGNPFYTDDWVWDTYRAAHPLRVLIEPDIEGNMVQSYIRMAQQSPDGWMPNFPEVTGDSHRMNGNHAVAVIWDAFSKGIKGIDLEAAYKACKGALTEKSLLPWTKVPANDLDRFYNEKGYFPALKPGEKETCADVNSWEKRQPVAVTLGNSYDDWCLSQMAKALHKTDDYTYFLKRSYCYRNLFNSETSFFHPKDADGNFIRPFDYRFSGGPGAREYYDENNGWTYRWDVQHNIADLVKLMGGAEKFTANLDATFREPLGKSKFEFYASLPDNTGNVGQFSMANEPSLHIPYLYNYAGEPWKTQKRIRQLLKYWFRNDLMGVPGDEDGGGMTAFVVFSSMGFYPVTPGSLSYNIGSPLFSDIKIKLGNGKLFEIIAKNCSADNKYIQSAMLNGKEWNKPWFSHSDIENGGMLVLIMGDKANTGWGSNPQDAPPSAAVLPR
jgi:predicted alpha-1,2-mannosidase